MNSDTKQPKELNVTTVFQDNYVIPIYQRNYAWGKDEVEQLLNDIADSNGTYCIGSLVVDKNTDTTFTVIDGQQRLTTLYLLLTYLKTGRPLEKSSLRFEARKKSNRTLGALFDNFEDLEDLEDDEEPYSKEIIIGYRIIKDYFETECAKSADFKSKFEKRLPLISIIRTQVPKKIDLNHYFEIMNTRGEQLEIHEIAKGRLLSRIFDEKNRNIAAAIWDACADMDSYIQMNFSKSLREKLFGPSWNSFQPKSFDDIRGYFSKTKCSSEIKFSLQEVLKGRQVNSNKSNAPEVQEENERFESILSFPNFLLIANEAMDFSENDTSLDDKHFLKTLERHWKDNDSALNFIFALLKLRFLFDVYIIKREFARNYREEGKWALQRLVAIPTNKPQYKATYDDGGVNYKEILLQSALRITYTSPKTMHWISLALSKLCGNESADTISLLEKYSCEKIVSADYKNAKGFAIDRIVFTYLDYVLLRDKKVVMPEGFYFQFRTSIEHFYPQNPIGDKRWKSADLNCFGNLALVSVSANSKFSNLPPKSKVGTYRQEIIMQSPKLKLMADLIENSEWTSELAQQHDKDMLSLLKNEIKSKQ